ncbi:MAG TPA: hypothetical protein VMF64_14610 [Steroidobacteraceae bacterium]|nr:hypothetical protein [Steroidobacteraceae bacterium]
MLLPDRRAVLRRTVFWLSAVIVVLPGVSFWILVPGSRAWMGLITAAPVAAALMMRLGLRLLAEHSGSLDDQRPVHLPLNAHQVICMFLGNPFMRLPRGLRTRIAASLGLLLWATPAALCLIRSTRPSKYLLMAYLGLSAIALWSWFMVALARFGSHRSGNFAELALLPGLGDASQRRHALYRAVLERPLLLALCGLGSFLLYEFWRSHAPGRVGGSILCCIVLLLVCCAMVFQLLMTKGSTGKRFAVASAVNATIIPLVLSQSVLTLTNQSWLSRPREQWIYYICLGLVASGPLTIIWLYTSSVATQAHPFLAQPE